MRRQASEIQQRPDKGRDGLSLLTLWRLFVSPDRGGARPVAPNAATIRALPREGRTLAAASRVSYCFGTYMYVPVSRACQGIAFHAESPYIAELMPIPIRSSRHEEVAEIQRYIAAHGITRCPTIYVEPTPLALPYTVEQARIATLAIRILRSSDPISLLKRLLACASRRQWKGNTTWWSGIAAEVTPGGSGIAQRLGEVVR